MQANRKNVARIGRGVWIPIVMTILCIPLAAGALPPLPHIFESGDPIVASEINANFEHLHGGVTDLESRGSYCGATALTDGSLSAPGGVVGYPAARLLCQQACGVATAHMCTGHEVNLALQEDTLVEGWYVGEAHHNCAGLTSHQSSTYATHVVRSNGVLITQGNGDCAIERPILCCR